MSPPRKPISIPRRPGRPNQDAADLRQHLLDVALARFVADGIGNTSLRSIAKAAGVTPALVSYYFGNRDLLVGAIFEERLMPVFAELLSMLAGKNPDDLVRGFVEGMHRLVEYHPWLPVLWVREILNDGGALRELLLTHIAPKLPQMLAARFAEAQRAGHLNADLDPRLLMVSLIGLTLFPLAARPIWSRVFNASDIDNQQLQKHTLALLERGLENTHAP